jgi:dynein heavy chain
VVRAWLDLFVGYLGDRVAVNFKSELREIIKETKYLDKMGYMVPEAAMNVALQETKYYSYEESLNAMLIVYSSVLGLLDPVEKKLLNAHINDLKRVMKPGFTRLNWNSLGIPEFIHRCNVEINKFSSIVNQIKKSAANIEHVVAEISRTMLIKVEPEAEIKDAFVSFHVFNG